LFLHDNIPAHRAPATGLLGLPVSWSPTLFSWSGPVGLPPVLWAEETIETSPLLWTEMDVGFIKC
jgi:hypothetical protein